MTNDVRENRLRRMAERQGLRLMKSRRRNPRAWDFGTHMLVDTSTDAIATPTAAGRAFGHSLDEIEEWLTQ